MEYCDIKDKDHIFIYGVCGRCGSTAVQRILNSSDEVCIWGESWGLTSILLETIKKVQDKYDDRWKRVKAPNFEIFKNSFREKNHNQFYANAFRNLDGLIDSLLNSFSDLFDPIINTDRIGFKEIELNKIDELYVLNKLFNNSQFLFIFRNPIQQYISVKSCGYFQYSNDLDLFLKKYKKYSDIYLDYYNRMNNSSFLENTILTNIFNINKILKFLRISNVDEKLINKKINSTQTGTLKYIDIKKIKNSLAYVNYVKMKKISDIFFNS